MSTLSDLHAEIASCRACELAKERTRVVPGEGAENADIVFIGEAPGWHARNGARAASPIMLCITPQLLSTSRICAKQSRPICSGFPLCCNKLLTKCRNRSRNPSN